MRSEIPKQFLPLNNKPIICHSIDKFLDADPSINIILVIPKVQLKLWKQIEKEYYPKFPPIVAYGGETRFESVKSGLQKVAHNRAIVAVHDAVRPLVSHEIINTSFDVAQLKGSAITAVPLKDSIRQIFEGGTRAMDRGDFYAVQTPQTFKFSLLKLAYGQKYVPSFTDDATVVEKMGSPVHLIEGSYSNIKITTPEDMKMAEMYL